MTEGLPSAPPKEELSPKATEVGIIQNRCPPPYPPPMEGVKDDTPSAPTGHPRTRVETRVWSAFARAYGQML